MHKNINASSTTLNITTAMFFLVFMLAYYTASRLPITGLTYSLMLSACSNSTWQSPEVAFATLTTTLIAIFATITYPFTRSISEAALKRTHNGASVAAASFLGASLCLFLSLFFIPCDSSLSGPGATSSARAGYIFIRLMSEYVFIYAAAHSLFIFGVFYGGVVFINLKIKKAVPTHSTG
jgi:hypothetical protein